MTLENFAAFERLLEPGIVKVDATYWRQARRCFFRPLLAFHPHFPGSIAAPRLAAWGGYQHAVPEGAPSNSFLNFVFFENTPAYSSESLDAKRKRQVRSALQHFAVRPIERSEEFKRKGYPAYLSFYERTQYGFGAKRRDRKFFDDWTEALFQIPGLLIRGGYRGGELAGVSLSGVIEETFLYAMFFCDTESMRLFLSDLMLHAAREEAVAHPQVRRIFAGGFKGNPGLDDFYRLRGAVVARQPAMLCLNPASRFLLRCAAPRAYAKLLGSLEGR